MGNLMKTPLYEEHLKLGARIIDFEGWQMPVYYTNLIEEHISTRKDAGIFDICHMGELFVEGKDAFDLVQSMITNDLEKLQDNSAFYSCMCLADGGVIDDLFVYRFDKQKFMLVVNASNIEKDFDWLLANKGNFDAAVSDRSAETAKIDLQGPKAGLILQKSASISLESLKRFSFAEAEIAGVPAIISRTGYTAEDGFELYFEPEKAADIWRLLLSDGKSLGLKPVGLGARDTLRMEACYSLYGHELRKDVSPFEAGIGFTVKIDKGDFIGKDALSTSKENIQRKIMAFEMLDKAIARKDYKAFKDGKEIGCITSGSFSPTFKKPIGMAMLAAEEAHEGNVIEIEIRGKLHKAVIVKRPIYPYHKA
ncbi:glycine cleavage system aminomethyltransferase GcvT [Candidatus Woesearchaeota archaeon]|nr:glycine cleavage system aminomethyltransferase GcvT [Candidatus Woesearchaeota archaeon]